MKLNSLLVLFLLATPLPAALAASVSCPDLARAVQVGACPAEEELRYTYAGYCSDDAKTYKGETDVCTDYRRYRALKNIALWESGDGVFTAYVSCDLPADKLKRARVAAVRVGKQGKMTQLVCSYGDGLSFTWRTRAECKVEAGANCAADPGKLPGELRMNAARKKPATAKPRAGKAAPQQPQQSPTAPTAPAICRRCGMSAPVGDDGFCDKCEKALEQACL